VAILLLLATLIAVLTISGDVIPYGEALLVSIRPRRLTSTLARVASVLAGFVGYHAALNVSTAPGGWQE